MAVDHGRVAAARLWILTGAAGSGKTMLRDQLVLVLEGIAVIERMDSRVMSTGATVPAPRADVTVGRPESRRYRHSPAEPALPTPPGARTASGAGR